MALVFSVATLYARNVPLHPIKMPACLNLGHGQEGRTGLRNKEITDESSGITAKQRVGDEHRVENPSVSQVGKVECFEEQS